MKTLFVSVFLFTVMAGGAGGETCASSCITSYRCGHNNPETSTCAAEDSCLSVNGDDFTRTRFSVPESHLEGRSEVTGDYLTSDARVYDSIRAHGGSGAPVLLVLELDVTLERFEPASGGFAEAGAEIELPASRALGVFTVATGKPGHQVDQRTLRLTNPIVPEGDAVVVDWYLFSGAGNGGTSSTIANWRVSTNDPTVTLEHCRDLPVPARTTSWGAVKSIYRG